MSVTLLWACNLTSVGDMLGDGVARSTLTKQVVFVIFLDLWCRSLRSHARALDC